MNHIMIPNSKAGSEPPIDILDGVARAKVNSAVCL